MKFSKTTFSIFFLLFTILYFKSDCAAQITEVPYNSDSTFYRVDLGIQHAEKCKYLFLEYDSIKTLPDNFTVLSQLRGITFRYCVQANWGQILSMLSKMPKLEYLEISVCKISKLNENIKLLKRLKSLNIKTNSFLTVPEWISDLKQLEYLNLSYNYNMKWDEVFNRLSSCESLKHLDISACNLLSLSNEIGSLKKLKKLMLNNNLLESLPESFNTLELEYLNASNSKQMNWKDAMDKISGITSLKILDISNNELTALPEKICLLKNLKELYVNGNELTELPEKIGDLDQLVILDMGTSKTMQTRNQIEKFPASFGKLVNLELLNMNGTYMMSLPNGIEKMTKLNELLISWCGLTSLKELEHCTNLNILRANHNYFDKIPDWIGNFSQLEILELDGNFFPGKAVPHIMLLPESICNLSSLKTLSLSDQLISSLPAGIDKLSSLEVLRLRNNKLEQLTENISGCKMLKELDLKANLLTTLPDLNALSSLENLDISLNDYIALKVEAAKFSSLKNLKTLDISYLKSDKETILTLRSSLPTTDIIYKTYDDLQFNPDKK